MPYIDYLHNLEAPRRSLLTYDLKQKKCYCDFQLQECSVTSYKIDDLQPLKKINLNLFYFIWPLNFKWDLTGASDIVLIMYFVNCDRLSLWSVYFYFYFSLIQLVALYKIIKAQF